MNVTDCCHRLLQSRSGSPRWSTTRMMLTLRTKWTRWAAPLMLPDNNGPVASTAWQIRVSLKEQKWAQDCRICAVWCMLVRAQSCCCAQRWPWNYFFFHSKKGGIMHILCCFVSFIPVSCQKFFWHCVCSFPQLMEVTGKNQDECMVALHDCNEDVSRAINFLLECTSDMVNSIIWLLSHLTASMFTCTLIFHWYSLFSHVNSIF